MFKRFLGAFGMAAVLVLSGCSSANEPTVPPSGAGSARVDQSAPITGGALFNGN